MPPMQSPNDLGLPPPHKTSSSTATSQSCKTSPSTTTSQSSSSPLPVSAHALRNNLDHILDDLTSSPTTSSTPQSLSSPLPSSRRDKEDMGLEKGKEEGSGENKEPDNKKGHDTEGPALSDSYAYHLPAEIKTEKKREEEGVKDCVIGDVLNTPCMTGPTSSSQYTGGVYLGYGLVSQDEQIRRDNLSALINEELSRRWEQQQQSPQAAAEEARYGSGAAPEWVLLEDRQSSSDGLEKSDHNTKDSHAEQKKSNMRASDHISKSPHLKRTTCAIPTTPVPRSGKKIEHSHLPTKPPRKALSPDALAKLSHEALLNDPDQEEQAELEELEKYRDDDLAPLDGIIADTDESDDLVEGGTPVKDAYRLYLRERSQRTSSEGQREDARIEREEEEEQQDMNTSATNTYSDTDTSISLSSAISSVEMMSRPQSSNSTDSNPEPDDSDTHIIPVRQIPPRRHLRRITAILRVVVVVSLGLLVALCVQLARLAVSSGYDGAVRLEL